MRISSGTLLVLLVLLGGCRGGERGAADSTGTSAGGGRRLPLPASADGSTNTATIITPRGPVAVQGDSAPNSTAVLAEPLQWTADVIIGRLREAGLAPVTRGTISAGLLPVPGLRLSVAGESGEVQAYLFADAGAVGAATRSFDANRAGTAGRPAVLVVDNNLAAVIVTGDALLRARLRAVLTARRGEGR